MRDAAMIWAMPSTMAVFPTPGSPIKHGLFFLLRTKVLKLLRTSSSRPCTISNFPSMASWVKSTPNSWSVGVVDVLLSPPATNSLVSSESFRSAINVLQNSDLEKSEAEEPNRRSITAWAPAAYPSGSSAPPTSPYSNNDSSTCSELIVSLLSLSAILPLFVKARFNALVNGNSTSFALRFILNKSPKLFPLSSFNSLYMTSNVVRALRMVIPYRMSVFRAFWG
mmetsp:Transcript_22865/g.27991  ORF Transcript_22865/g.27991 Transcript_22865/m.27991 type:complete len:224 (-) Transcript_22865:521-1192(-)